MSDFFVKTREEAKKKRSELKDHEHDAYFVKLKWEQGYNVYSCLKAWRHNGKKKAKA